MSFVDGVFIVMLCLIATLVGAILMTLALRGPRR